MKSWIMKSLGILVLALVLMVHPHSVFAQRPTSRTHPPCLAFNGNLVPIQVVEGNTAALAYADALKRMLASHDWMLVDAAQMTGPYLRVDVAVGGDTLISGIHLRAVVLLVKDMPDQRVPHSNFVETLLDKVKVYRVGYEREAAFCDLEDLHFEAQNAGLPLIPIPSGSP